jgi:O-succinylbenzoate synthase
MVWRGAAGWAEWSPFLDYAGPELVSWLRAADEAAEQGWPAPVRDEVAVNSTIPAVGPEQAYARARAAGCRTAKVKVAEAGQSLTEDLARVAAVRDALGVDGRVRVDANGAWSVAEAEDAVTALARFGLEYVEQPCRTVTDLATLRVRLARAGVDVPVAADESIRRADDPFEVARRAAADVAVLKVQPLGGIRAAQDIAERIGLPVVVSSALETSVGLRAGLALAATLPELPYACGLNTHALLAGDLVAEPLAAVDGVIRLREVAPDPDQLDRHQADPATHAAWRARLAQTRALMLVAAGG